MKVLFILYPQGPPEKAGYEHGLLALAEGLSQLDIQPLGNINYWRRSDIADDYVISKAEYSDLNEFDLVVFSSTLYGYNRMDLLPKGLFDQHRKFKLIFIDESDGLITPGNREEMRHVDYVLKCHFGSKYTYPRNFVPWQFGLTERIINSAKPKAFEDRADTISSNFRVNHQLRQFVEENVMSYLYGLYPKEGEVDDFSEKEMVPLDKYFWEHTGMRHYPAYYKRLGSSKIVNATGGFLQNKVSKSSNITFKIVSQLNDHLGFFKYDRIYQFDSWRFWESLISGCCTLHIDLEKYGALLPIMPQNKRHYLGIDLDNVEVTKEILSCRSTIQSIAENGREWVLSNYAPKPVAERFLSLIQ